MVVLANGSGSGVVVTNWGAEGGQSTVLLLLLCLSVLFLFFFIPSSSLILLLFFTVFFPLTVVLLSLAVLLVAIGCWFQAVVKKKQSLLLFFPFVQRHQFLPFLHDCCSAAHREKKMAEADNDAFSNGRERDKKESEVIVLLCYLFSFLLFFFVPCFKNNLPVLVFFSILPPSLFLFSILSLSQNFCPPPQNLLSSPFVSPFSLCLSSKSCPPPSISGSHPVFIGSRGKGHPTLSKCRVRWCGAASA
jgi:hypothetical protein